MGLAPGTATCLLLVSLDDTFIEAASLCLLIVCRTGHHGPKFCVQGRGKKCKLPFTLWSVAVSSCCSYITFMECRHWHLCTILCPILFYLKENTIGSWGSPWCSPQAVDIWLLVPLTYGKSLIVQLFDTIDGLACLGFCFYLFFNSETLHPLPAVNPSLWGGRDDIALLFVSFFIIFLL